MLTKSHYTVLFIIFGSLSLNFLNSPLSEIFFDDKEIFKYAGLVIYKGGVPYRDFFDHKPPLIYFLNYFYWINPWIPWMLDSVLILFASLLFYWLCRKKNLGWPWILPLLFNLMIRYSLVSFGNGMTREYTAAFLLMFFCVMEGNARYKYFIMGLLAGLTCWMQQDALLTLAPFLFYSIFVSEETISISSGRRVLAICLGFIFVSLPVILYFAGHQSVSWLWKDAFAFNLHPPGIQAGLLEKIKSIKHAIHETEFEMVFYTALTLGIAALFLKTKKPHLLYIALLTLVFSFSAEFITGRLATSPGFMYYLLPLAASVPVLVFVVFAETQASFIQDKTAQLLFSCMLSITLLLGTFRYATGFHISENKDLFDGNPEIKYLKTASLGDYDLFVFDNSNLIYLYNYHKILSPSPWIYQYFWNWSPDWDRDNKVLPSILQNLQLHKTRFILDYSQERNDIKNISVVNEWQQFLQSHYALFMKDSLNRKLWMIQ